MARKIQKLLAVLTVVSMSLSLLSFQALAAESESVTTTNPDGTTLVTTTTTEEKTDESGNPTVVVTIEKDINDEIGDNVTDDGVTVTLDATRTEKYESKGTDENGAPIKGELQHYVDEGTETKEWTENDTGDTTSQPPVSVDLIPGETTTGTATTTTTTGDVPTGETDPEYDYTKTTLIDRIITAITGKVDVTVNEASSDLTSVVPDNYEGKEDINEYRAVDPNESVTGTAPDGYDYQLIGYGDFSANDVVAAVTVHYAQDEHGNTKLDENGKPVISHLTDYWGRTLKVDGEVTTDLGATFDGNLMMPSAAQLVLKDEQGNLVYTYCLDVETSEKIGAWYTISNLEDSDYYASKDAEEHIRSIVTHGYWGTSNDLDENNNYQTGSLEKVKQDLLNAIDRGEIANTVVREVEDDDGNKTVIYLKDVIGDMTEGEALDMTQAAIWTYSNGAQSVLNGKDGMVVGNPTYGVSDTDAKARMDALYNWLIGLKTEEESTTVINEKNFLGDVSLTVGDKVGSKTSTTESGEEVVNGVYDAALNFTLAFIPSADNKDDLLVHVTYKDLDGNDVSVIKRLAGTAAEGETYGTITPDEDGNYTITGLKLSENEDFDFDLRLEGTQYLEQGVYVYTAEGGKEVSQTMVGIAEGTRHVDVTTSLTVRFDVDEDDHITATRTWRDEGPDRNPGGGDDDDDITPPDGDDDIDDEDVPLVEIPDEEIPLGDASTSEIPDEEIPLVDMIDEEVPLAEIPETGDASALWLMMSALSGTSLAGVAFLGRKKREEI